MKTSRHYQQRFQTKYKAQAHSSCCEENLLCPNQNQHYCLHMDFLYIVVKLLRIILGGFISIRKPFQVLTSHILHLMDSLLYPYVLG